jgi:hypothetical protein
MSKKPKSLTTQSVLAPVPDGLSMPFYYHSLLNCELFFYVKPDVLQPYLSDTGLSLALMDNYGIVTYNFQNYTAQFAGFDSVVLELEYNILAYPTSRAKNTPTLSLAEFLHGDDQTKLIGNHHVHVACTNANAVDAGKKLFSEPKFLANINSNVPSPNSPGIDTWSFVCSDYDQANPGNTQPMIFQTDIDLRSFEPVIGNASPNTEYGYVNNKLVSARWNIYGVFLTYSPESTRPLNVKLTYGTSTVPMRTDAQKMLDGARCGAVRTFQSAPVATQARAFFVDP